MHYRAPFEADSTVRLQPTYLLARVPMETEGDSVNILNGDHLQYEIDNAGLDPRLRPDWPMPSFNANDWAEAFNKQHPAVSIDDARAWFACALMSAYDKGREEAKS